MVQGQGLVELCSETHADSPTQLPGKGERSQLLNGVETKPETRNLGLFCGLCRSCFFFLGISSRLQMQKVQMQGSGNYQL